MVEALFQTAASTDSMISVEEAQGRVIAEARPGSVESLGLTDSLGRVLAESVVAVHDVPGHTNSAMDGYAVRSADLALVSPQSPVTLRVTGDVPAGAAPPGTLVEPGSAVRIMTGAPLPEGADAVVPVESTDGGFTVVSIFERVERGANIRERGEDMRAGETVLVTGTLIGPGEVGVLASLMKAAVTVGSAPEVSILSTGDEVVDLHEERSEGRVVNSNAYALEAFVRQYGARPRRRGIVGDSLDETVRAIEEALDSEIVITTGGVSVGAYDWVRQAIERLGGDVKFWRVAMKPGKPVLFATVRDRLFFGLPGNPVSCLVTFVLFVGPAIRRIQGATVEASLPPTVRVKVDASMVSPKKRRDYQRVRVVAKDGALVALPRSRQGSGILTSMVESNGLAVVDEGVSFVEAGSEVPVVLYGPILTDS